MCVSSCASILSALYQAKPVLAPRNVLFGEEPEKSSLLMSDSKTVRESLLWKHQPPLSDGMNAIRSVKSIVSLLINSKNISAVSRGPDFVLLSWYSPAIILWFLFLQVLL